MAGSLEFNHSCDNELFSLIKNETDRQKKGIELIASENFTSTAVLACLGSNLTNKYSEGYPAHRYYGGNQVIDQIELLCQQRALQAFDLSENEWGVNVQPYSGSPANFAVFTGLLSPHDRIMGLHLPDGGHLTHGFMTSKKRVSATSIFWESISYRLNPETELIDYDKLAESAINVKPKLIIAGFSCYTRHLDFTRFRKIADSVGALLMVDMAHVSGLIAAKLYPSPFKHAHVVTTTTHKTLRGPRAGLIFYSKAPGPNKEDIGSKINNAVFPGLQGGPHNNVIAGIATCLREANTPAFVQYTQQVIENSKHMAAFFISKGYTVATNGTDNHIVLLNVKKSLDIDGEQAETILDRVGISVNKNACSNDTSVLRPSGIRIGSPAMTTRGLKQQEFTRICEFIDQTLRIAQKIVAQAPTNAKINSSQFKVLMENETQALDNIMVRVEEFSSAFPLPVLV